MGDVVRFNGLTRLKMDPDVVLTEAVGNLETAIVIGYDKDGEAYFASSDPDGGNCLWLMELFKKRLLD
jgi:hypothetical protein